MKCKKCGLPKKDDEHDLCSLCRELCEKFLKGEKK